MLDTRKGSRKPLFYLCNVGCKVSYSYPSYHVPSLRCPSKYASLIEPCWHGAFPFPIVVQFLIMSNIVLLSSTSLLTQDHPQHAQKTVPEFQDL